MAFNTNPGKQQFSASAGQTAFAFNFAIFADTDLKVYLTPSGNTADDAADILTLTTDYSVSINGTLGGTVTLSVGASLNDTVTIVRVLPVTRTTDYAANGDLYADTLDADQDYQTYLVLDGYTQLQRALIVPESLSNVELDLPAPVSDSYIKWNTTADALENDTTIPTNVVLSQAAASTATTQAGLASASATDAQLRAWEAEAEKLTADSYATEAEDVFVKVYTSNGDGTFAATFTTEYSALHWNAKAQATIIVVDATPTDGSNNPVASNGVFDALAGKSDTTHNHTGVYEPANANIAKVNVAQSFTDINDFQDLKLKVKSSDNVHFATLSNTSVSDFTLDLSQLQGKQILHVRDQKTSGTAAGATVVGFQTRTLNTVVTNNISGASLSSNQVTLPAGTYRFYGSAQGVTSGGFKSFIYNVTDASYAINGQNAVVSTAATTTGASSLVHGELTIASSKVFELRQYFTNARATDALGYPVSSGQAEVYAELFIIKVA